MNLNKKDIAELDKIRRLNIINSLTGIKPANLIGTVSNSGQTNLAIFSSVVHLGSNPALIGFIMRPNDEVPRHTYQNIEQKEVYTINHVHSSFMEQSHYTSAKFDADVSEFDVCKFTEEYITGFQAPFVKQSVLKLGLRFKESMPIKANGTIMVIGEIEHIIIPDEAISENGYINLSKTNSVGISGLNSYYTLQKTAEYPYARVSELPTF